MKQLLLRLFLVLSLYGMASPAVAQENPTYVATLKTGLALMRDGHWEAALDAAGAPGTIRRDIIEWHRLRAGKGAFADTIAFLDRRPTWPGLKLLRKRSEQTIAPGSDPATVLAFFAPQPPQTGHGALMHAQALTAQGKGDEGRAQAVLAWFSMLMSEEEEAALLADYADALAPYHWQRLDMLLWQGESKAAERIMPLVDEAHQALARARIALRKREDGVNALIDLVPTALQSDPGLAYERFVWRARAGYNDSAIDMALTRSTSAESLGDPERWGRRRADLARWAMREGKARTAYRLAANHHIPEGSRQVDLEWLAGYISLRKLGDAATALTHFKAMKNDHFSAITQGRTHYWIGRAHEALGQSTEANAAYVEAARFQTSFYGQLASEKVGIPMTPALAGANRYTGWQESRFWSDSNMVAGRLLHAAGEDYLALRFTQHLAESLSEQERGQLLAWAEAVEAPYLQVKLAKYLLRLGTLFERPFFALADLGATHPDVPAEYALAIARRESEFNPLVISHAGARGLMQLMPGTASDMAQKLGIEYSKARLTSDPAYNATLGHEYLAGLFTSVGPNPILVAVGYNAGPGRARSWKSTFGHPGDPGVDPIDWIEHIPFYETRNYAMRVTESLAIYRARRAGKPVPITLTQDLKTR
jgi:soluble lytic murein transglycosylase